MNIILEKCSENRELWLEKKAGKIGSSQIATVAGINPWKSRLEFWVEMTGKADNNFDNDQMWLGRELEPVVGKLFTRRTKLKTVGADCLVQHPKYDFALASPDFWVLEKDDFVLETDPVSMELAVANEHISILEAKTGRDSRKVAWLDGAPSEYVLQLCWQQGCCGIEKGYIAGLLGNDPASFNPEPFEYNHSLFEQVATMAAEFMELVRKDIPPIAGPGDAKTVAELQGARAALTVALTAEAEVLADNLEDANTRLAILNKQVQEMKDIQDGAKARLLQMLGAYTGGRLPSGRLVSAKTVERGSYVAQATSWVDVRIAKTK